MVIKKKKSLGRGLSALLPPKNDEKSQLSKDELLTLDIHTVLPCDDQPRQIFDQDGIDDLSKSILRHGLLQPIVVRKKNHSHYEIIAGERRWRASQQAGLKYIKAIVSDIAEKDTLTVALVENLQRKDLNPMEEAKAFYRLNKDLGLTQAEIAEAVGKDRVTITNALRLLKLPKKVQMMVLDHFLSMGHARALLALKNEHMIHIYANKVVKDALNVRQTEALVAKILKEDSKETSSPKGTKEESANERDIRLQLQRLLSTKIEMKHKSGKGHFKVYFSNYEELDEVLNKMGLQK